MKNFLFLLFTGISALTFASVGDTPYTQSAKVSKADLKSSILKSGTLSKLEYNSCDSSDLVSGLSHGGLSNVLCRYSDLFTVISSAHQVNDEANVGSHYNDQDWARNWYKRECAQGEAAVGLGSGYDGSTLMCARVQSSNGRELNNNSCEVVWFNDSDRGYGGEDFLPGEYKLWIADYQYIAGIASYKGHGNLSAALVCDAN